MKKYIFAILVGCAITSIAAISSDASAANKAKPTPIDLIGAWKDMSRADAMVYRLRLQGGNAPEAEAMAEKSKKSLEDGFKSSLAAARGKPSLAQAVKDFYLAATAFYREATRRTEMNMDAAADKLGMELTLAK